MYKYSMTQWIVGNEDMEYSFQRLQKYGYDGIEFAAEPATLDARHLRALMARYGISCTSLCGIFPGFYFSGRYFVELLLCCITVLANHQKTVIFAGNDRAAAVMMNDISFYDHLILYFYLVFAQRKDISFIQDRRV